MSDDEISNESVALEADVSFAEFMKRPTTLPADLIITLTNFTDEEDAHKCANIVRGYLEVFGRWMELSRLDHMYISFDYAGTLASIDLGTSSETILKPTNDEVATGVAMAPSVLREDGWKSVIVMNATYARSLSYEPDESDGVTEEQLEAFRAETLHILAHECGHVHDHTLQWQSMPAETHSTMWTRMQHRLKEPARACWSEYIAEYFGASFATKDTLHNYEDSFCQRLSSAWPTMTASIRQYRMHGDIDRVISEVGLQIRNVITYAAYLFGYLANKKESLEQAAPKAVQVSQDCPEMGAFTERLQSALQALHDQYPDFTSLAVFDPLSEIVHEMYKKAGLTFTEKEDGMLRVDIPHRVDTLPSFAEQIEYLSKSEVNES